jgi:protein gp37
MNHTKIEWVRNPDGSQGYTWNPITGCLNHINGLCKGGGFPCYAYKLANGRLKQRYLANIMGTGYLPETHKLSPDPFYPRFWPERIPTRYWIPTQGAGLGLNVKGKGIFVCDMGELFGDWIPKQWQEDVFRVIRGNPDCRFYLLTKQPQNLIKWSPFPENCWVGVTATSAEMAYQAHWYLQNKVEAKVKYLSLEPLLEPILFDDLDSISWLIIGAWTGSIEDKYKLRDRYPELNAIPYQNKVTLQPKIEWVKEMVEAADRAGIPVFEKDNLKPLLGDNLRQEMPDGSKEV